MGIHWAEPGAKAVGEYQLSALPYVTSSILNDEETLEIRFKRLTKFVIVRNRITGTATAEDCVLAVGFTDHGVKGDVLNFPQPLTGAYSGHNYIKLDVGESLSVDVRVSRIFLSNSNSGRLDKRLPYELFAGLTDISADKQLLITGSHGYEGVG